MSTEDRDLWPGEVFAKRLREVRKRRDWTQQQLADRLEELGYKIDRVILTRIESGRSRARQAKLEEVLAISFALGVSPLHMIVPFDRDLRLRVPGCKQPMPPLIVRRWLQGLDTLADEDPRWFWTEVPPEDLDEVLEQARQVRQGTPSGVQERFVREDMAERGEMPPIIPEDEREAIARAIREKEEEEHGEPAK